MGLCWRCVLPSQGWTLRRRNKVQEDDYKKFHQTMTSARLCNSTPNIVKYRKTTRFRNVRNVENLGDAFFCKSTKIHSRTASPTESCEIDSLENSRCVGFEEVENFFYPLVGGTGSSGSSTSLSVIPC